jgi:hypothetical protein
MLAVPVDALVCCLVRRSSLAVAAGVGISERSAIRAIASQTGNGATSHGAMTGTKSTNRLFVRDDTHRV